MKIEICENYIKCIVYEYLNNKQKIKIQIINESVFFIYFYNFINIRIW